MFNLTYLFYGMTCPVAFSKVFPALIKILTFSSYVKLKLILPDEYMYLSTPIVYKHAVGKVLISECSIDPTNKF